MDPCLVIVGLDFRSAPPELRQRFWMNDSRRSEALRRLSGMEGVGEVMVLSSRERTEFILWTSDFASAANSAVNFLSDAYGLKLSEWKHFYRWICEEALLHMFRLAAGLESAPPADTPIAAEVTEAWVNAQQAGTSGRMLEMIVRKALAMSRRAQVEMANRAEAEALLAAEAQDFHAQLSAERVAHGVGELRERLPELR